MTDVLTLVVAVVALIWAGGGIRAALSPAYRQRRAARRSLLVDRVFSLAVGVAISVATLVMLGVNVTDVLHGQR
ncbi:MAG: hypothetical protein ACRDXX_01175 [Stackebrandtia sp.]